MISVSESKIPSNIGLARDDEHGVVGLCYMDDSDKSRLPDPKTLTKEQYEEVVAVYNAWRCENLQDCTITPSRLEDADSLLFRSPTRVTSDDAPNRLVKEGCE